MLNPSHCGSSMTKQVFTSTGIVNRFVALVVDAGTGTVVGHFAAAVHFDVGVAAGHIFVAAPNFNNTESNMPFIHQKNMN